MKKKVLLVFVTLYINTTEAQIINNVPISKLDAEYVEITGCCKAFKNAWNIELDYGQEVKGANQSKQKTIMEDGKIRYFNALVDALNFMANYHYELVHVFPIKQEDSGKRVKYRYLLRRKKILN